jgi:uncharacterized membrane protein
MGYYPAAFFLEKRDVIGAWLICGAIATAFFGGAIALQSVGYLVDTPENVLVATAHT